MTVLSVSEEKLFMKRDVRENLIKRLEVLEKVKDLLLLPALELATTQQVADYFEVSDDAVQNIVKRHKDELLSDGYCSYTGSEVKSLVTEKNSVTKIINKRGYFIVETDNGYVKMANRSNGLFPRRAILRVGMLLRDSEVAKEVRTQLLNIEEKAPEVMKKAEVDNEVTLLEQAVGKAFASNDIMKFAEATMKLNAYKDRYTKQVEAKLEETTTIHASSLDCLVTSKSFAERFEYKGIPATSKQLNDILIKAGYVERNRKGLTATDKGRQLGAKVRTGQTDTYKYTYVLWPNRVVEGVFYSIFKEYGVDYKTK